HREPGDPPSGGRIGQARCPCLDARRHHRLPGHRRGRPPPPAAPGRPPPAPPTPPPGTPRPRPPPGKEGRHGRRLFLSVPDADAVPRPASAGRGRSGDVPRL